MRRRGDLRASSWREDAIRPGRGETDWSWALGEFISPGRVRERPQRSLVVKEGNMRGRQGACSGHQDQDESS